MSSLAPAQTVMPPALGSDIDVLTGVLPSVSAEVRRGIATFIEALKQGSAVRVEPVSTSVTTGQAADILNISRMTLIKLLDEGVIPYEQPRVHRTLRLADVLAYKEERSKRRREYFVESARNAAADGTLFVSFDEAVDAVNRIR